MKSGVRYIHPSAVLWTDPTGFFHFEIENENHKVELCDSEPPPCETSNLLLLFLWLKVCFHWPNFTHPMMGGCAWGWVGVPETLRKLHTLTAVTCQRQGSHTLKQWFSGFLCTSHSKLSALIWSHTCFLLKITSESSSVPSVVLLIVFCGFLTVHGSFMPTH